MIGKIEHRKSLWKKRKYHVVESGPGWRIERPGEPAPSLDMLLKRALRKKRFKWE